MIHPISESLHGDSEAVAISSSTKEERKPTIENVSTIPDGGLRAWLQVVGSFFLFFNTFGLTNTFGIYQTYYESGALFSSTPAAISWIGSIQGFLLQFLGSLSGPLYDAGYFRLLITSGSSLVIFGQMMLSLCHEYWQALLAQGFCIGVGAGCLFLPCVAILSQYFDKRLATATGLAAVGSSLGGIFYPIAFYKLLPHIGFAWATRALGLIAACTLLVSILVMRVRVVPAQRRRLLDLSAFGESPYTLFTVGCFISWLGLYGPYFYVELFSLKHNLGGVDLSFYTLAILNTGSVFGRLISNFLADRTGPLNMIAPASVISGILAFCLVPVRGYVSLAIVCALYGFSSGALVSLYSTVYIRLSTHKRALLGTRMGMGLLTTSFALLLGTPICGWILDASTYTYVWLFSGLLLCAGGLFMYAAKIVKTWAEGLFAKA